LSGQKTARENQHGGQGDVWKKVYRFLKTLISRNLLKQACDMAGSGSACKEKMEGEF